MGEATGMEARTIHRLLEVDPKAGGFRRGPDNPLDCNLLVCVFRRSRPWIPSEGGRPFRSKPAGDSDDPGHFGGVALVSARSSGQAAGSASRF
jgi:hypothetical protein